MRRRAPGTATSYPDGDLRVVHVITALGPGGAERQVEQLARRACGSRVTVVCLYAAGLVADSLRAAGVDVVVLGMGGWMKLTAPFRLARLLRSMQPDVVNVHLLAGQLWGVPAARLAGVGVIVSTEHSLMDDTIEGRPLRRWLRAVYLLVEALSSHTVAVSATGRQRLVAWGVPAARVSVIDNAVDLGGATYSPSLRGEARAALGIDEGTTVIGAVGRLEPVKRFQLLIEAAAPLLADGLARMVIVGQGSQHHELAAVAARLGLTDRVHLLGPRADVLSLLDGFDVFASPSLDETFGIAVLEAVANGLPTLYGQCPALEDLGSPAGTRIPAGPDELGRWTRALQTAAAHPTRRPVPAELLERYDAERVSEAYLALYRRLLPAAHRDPVLLHPWPRTRRSRQLEGQRP